VGLLFKKLGHNPQGGCCKGPRVFARFAQAPEEKFAQEHFLPLHALHSSVVGAVSRKYLLALFDGARGSHHLSVEVEHPGRVGVARVVEQCHGWEESPTDHLSTPIGKSSIFF